MENKFSKKYDELEDIDFNPITEGLGFHHSLAEKSKISVELNSQKKNLADDLENRSTKLSRLMESHDLNHVEHMGELAAFYEPKADSIPPLVEKSTVAKTYNVSMGIRFCAWMLDLVVVSFMFLVSAVGIFLFAELPFDTLAPFMVSNDIIPSFIVIYLMFYIFYFTILDRTQNSTVGKRLLGLKVIAMRGTLNLNKTLFRVSLSLLSVFSLGLLTILSLHDSFTDTQVIKE